MNAAWQMTDEQRTAVHRSIAELTKAFPCLSRKEIVKGPFALEMLGAIPSYSNRKDYQLTNVTTTTVGAFAVYFGTHPISRETSFILVKREPKNHTEPKYGVPGGYVNVDVLSDGSGEQPAQGTVRELGEEICDPLGRPILSINPSRLILIQGALDYRQGLDGGLSTQVNGYTRELSDQEMATVYDHTQRLGRDSVYAEGCYLASKGETADVSLCGLSQLDWIRVLPFAHPHELAALIEAADCLAKKPVQRRHLYSPLAALVVH